MRQLILFPILFAACSSNSAPSGEPPVAAAPTPAPAAAVQARTSSAAHREGHAEEVNPRLLRRFKQLRTDFAASGSSKGLEDLGRMLYFDKRLSRDQDLSCNSCHALDAYGVDGHATSTGEKGQLGKRNSPTVYNAAGHFTDFWDGRALNVEEQAKGPILNPVEMAMPSGDAVVARLAAIPGYVAAFSAAFPGDAKPLTYEHVGSAIGAFERKLVTPSRWDRYLAGDHTALTSEEAAGFKVFTDIGCMTCHTGELVGGSMFQKVGVQRAWPNQTDQGRINVTKAPSDAMLFKVPSLRNVAKTAPYFHDGSAKTLPEAVKMMAQYQLAEDLSDDDINSIIAWLGALTGDLPKDYITPPTLP